MRMQPTSIIRRFSAGIGAIAMLSCALPVYGVTEIRTAAQDSSEPKFVALSQDAKNAVGGLCVDVMRAIEHIEPSLKFVGDQTWQPLLRIEAGVASGHLDACCGLLRTKRREANYTYIEPPLFPVNYYLVVRADDNVQVNDWNDIRNLGSQGVILAINGFGIIRKLEEEGGLRIDAGAYTSKANFDKLLAGRGRFYIHRSPGIAKEISRAGMQSKVKLLPTVIYTEKFHMVVSKTLPAETVEKMRKAIAALEKSGELKKILEKWEAY